ncbi:MAG: hydratase [Deltaproteobacteria bacterium]|nr:hydratase [Deltaproteobacteria bacterium]
MAEPTAGPRLDLTVAVCQFGPAFGEVAQNVKRSLALIEEAAGQGAELVILPELCSSGYAFQSAREVAGLAEPVPDGPTVRQWQQAASDLHVHVIAGLPERQGPACFNAAVVLGPDGHVGTYRKTHLYRHEKLYFEPGDLGFPVFRLAGARVGVLICYDLRFVEAARLLMLQGADLVAVPTNWVPGFDRKPGEPPPAPGSTMHTRVVQVLANLHQLFMACADRTGEERGVRFIGESLIVGPGGELLAGPAGMTEEAVLVSRLDLVQARVGKIKNELDDTVRERRTDLYDEMLGYRRHPRGFF